LVGTVGVPVVLLAAFLGGFFFLILVEAILVVSLLEFYAMSQRKGASPAKLIGVLSAVAISLALYFNDPRAALSVVAVTVVLLHSIELFRQPPNPFLNLSTTLLGVLYPSLLYGFLLLLRELPKEVGIDYGAGGRWLVFLFLAIWICDSAAYFVGGSIGRLKLFPRVSPNKTWEGAVAGFIAALLTAWGCHVLFLQDLALVHALAIGTLCGTVGQLSDLVESLFKRDVGLKDTSSLLPGHGGILDRFDSQIFVGPVVYYYLRLVVF